MDVYTLALSTRVTPVRGFHNPFLSLLFSVYIKLYQSAPKNNLLRTTLAGRGQEVQHVNRRKPSNKTKVQDGLVPNCGALIRKCHEKPVAPIPYAKGEKAV
jgi:hypothetical protein